MSRNPAYLFLLIIDFLMGKRALKSCFLGTLAPGGQETQKWRKKSKIFKNCFFRWKKCSEKTESATFFGGFWGVRRANTRFRGTSSQEWCRDPKLAKNPKKFLTICFRRTNVATKISRLHFLAAFENMYFFLPRIEFLRGKRGKHVFWGTPTPRGSRDPKLVKNQRNSKKIVFAKLLHFSAAFEHIFFCFRQKSTVCQKNVARLCFFRYTFFSGKKQFFENFWCCFFRHFWDPRSARSQGTPKTRF